jgi:peptidyl-prolyl cis-trans isomerase B (cyclophilin B)
MVIIEMADGGIIQLELNRDKAPNTVDNFLHLVQKGFYDGLTFHRIISGFMIQGGCPKGTGIGGPGYCIRGEFAANGFPQNDLKHERGIISMARANNPNSAGAQFFIMHQDGFFLDGQYAAFGKVVKGMEVVDQIAAVPTDAGDKPQNPQVIKRIYLENEEEVKEPEKV